MIVFLSRITGFDKLSLEYSIDTNYWVDMFTYVE